MKRKYLAFDIEVAKCLPGAGSDWLVHRPLGISCAAMVGSDGNQALKYATRVSSTEGVVYESKMPEKYVRDIVSDLCFAVKDGYTLLTHNGLSFDFDVLAEESGMFAECRELALHSVDSCYMLMCMLGYPIGLDALAKGMGLPGKPPGMDGSKAPELWAAGEYQTVLDYCAGDCRTLLDIVAHVERTGSLWWVTKKGVRKPLAMPYGWLTVAEAMQLPLPDTSWMSGDRLTRERFTEWLKLGEATPAMGPPK